MIAPLILIAFLLTVTAGVLALPGRVHLRVVDDHFRHRLARFAANGRIGVDGEIGAGGPPGSRRPAIRRPIRLVVSDVRNTRPASLVRSWLSSLVSLDGGSESPMSDRERLWRDSAALLILGAVAAIVVSSLLPGPRPPTESVLSFTGSPEPSEVAEVGPTASTQPSLRPKASTKPSVKPPTRPASPATSPSTAPSVAPSAAVVVPPSPSPTPRPTPKPTPTPTPTPPPPPPPPPVDPPTIVAWSALPTDGKAPLLVVFEGVAGGADSWTIDFGDGSAPVQGVLPTIAATHGYAENGRFDAILTVTNAGGSVSQTVTITVGKR